MKAAEKKALKAIADYYSEGRQDRKENPKAGRAELAATLADAAHRSDHVLIGALMREAEQIIYFRELDRVSLFFSEAFNEAAERGDTFPIMRFLREAMADAERDLRQCAQPSSFTSSASNYSGAQQKIRHVEGLERLVKKAMIDPAGCLERIKSYKNSEAA